MKKSLILAITMFLWAGVANAQVDQVSAAQKVQDKIDAATQQKSDTEAALEAKKAEVVEQIEAKKAEVAEKQAEQNAESEAKAAERKAAVEGAKNALKNDASQVQKDLNSLKNAFSK